MRIYGLILLALPGACSQEESNESGAAPAAAAAATIEPIALTAFERRGAATIARARAQRQARDLEAKAKRALETYLFDPFSLRLRNLRSGRGGSVCGEVNAKNRMGAYVGFKDFVVGRDGRTIWMSNSNDGLASDLFSSFAEAYANACASAADTRRYREAHRPYDYGNYVEPYYPAPTDDARQAFEEAESGLNYGSDE
ncbi:MAG TPA: hypothetical protein VGB79_05975 [Allosphingosinicella sp.]|jgi:hypothetical protein